MRYFFSLGLLLIIITSACDTGVKENKPEEEKKITKIRNGIKINSKGVKVDQAYLIFADDGNLVPEDNKFKLNQEIKMILISSGWKAVEGKVKLKGGELAQTSEGGVLLDEKYIFKNGLAEKDAGYITFRFVLKAIYKSYDFFKVSFYVKDQNDPERMVEGSYKLYLE